MVVWGLWGEGGSVLMYRMVRVRWNPVGLQDVCKKTSRTELGRRNNFVFRIENNLFYLTGWDLESSFKAASA